MTRRHQRKRPSLWGYYGALVALTIGAIFAVSLYTSYTYRNTVVELSRQLRAEGSIDLEATERRFQSLEDELFIETLSFGCLLAMVLGGVCYLFYRGLQPPLWEMRLGAERFAKGEFDQKLPQYHLREINKLAQEMNKMGSQLRHLEEVRRDFVANVSHELKTPITSIKGFVETLLDGALEDKDDLYRFLEIIGKQAERLTLIIEDLLTLARLENGNIEDLLVPQETAVHEVLHASVDMCKEFAAVKNISIEVRCDLKLRATFDRSLVEQAVGNLVNNAIKYSGPESNIRVSGGRLHELIEIAVSDEGPGISPEHLPRLFERFYRVDKARTRKIGGTGLGLAIVKHVASVHHGSVEVRSVPGKGSTFFFRIPAV